MDHFIQLLQVPQSQLSVATVRALIHQILGHPSIYAGYAEVYSLPSVRELLHGGKAGERGVGGGDAALRTLELFAHGTLPDYIKVILIVMQ